METDNKQKDLRSKFFAAWNDAKADKAGTRVIIETDKELSAFYSHGFKYTEYLYYMIDGADGLGGTFDDWLISTSEGNSVWASEHNIVPFALKMLKRKYEHITNIYSEGY